MPIKLQINQIRTTEIESEILINTNKIYRLLPLHLLTDNQVK